MPSCIWIAGAYSHACFDVARLFRFSFFKKLQYLNRVSELRTIFTLGFLMTSPSRLGGCLVDVLHAAAAARSYPAAPELHGDACSLICKSAKAVIHSVIQRDTLRRDRAVGSVHGTCLARTRDVPRTWCRVGHRFSARLAPVV